MSREGTDPSDSYSHLGEAASLQDPKNAKQAEQTYRETASRHDLKVL